MTYVYDSELSLLENRYNRLRADREMLPAMMVLYSEYGRESIPLLIRENSLTTLLVADPRVVYDVLVKKGVFTDQSDYFLRRLRSRILQDAPRRWIMKHQLTLERRFNDDFSMRSIGEVKTTMGSMGKVVPLGGHRKRTTVAI